MFSRIESTRRSNHSIFPPQSYGSPFNFHSARRSLTNVGLSSLELSLARDKIVFPLVELTGAIWMADERRE